MSLAISIDLYDGATPRIDKCKADLNSEQMKNVIGGAGRRLFQDHFAELDADRPNALGGKRTHYFANAARGTSYDIESDGVTLSVNQTGIAQRYFGGIIKPVNGKALTIPACAEAYGHRAGEFNNLELIWPKGHSVGMLIERQNTTLSYQKDKRKGRQGQTRIKEGSQRGGKIFFWLVSSVNQDPDKTILPDESLLESTILEAISDYLEAS